MSKINEINNLLPDNNTRKITEQNVRDAFAIVLEQVDQKLKKDASNVDGTQLLLLQKNLGIVAPIFNQATIDMEKDGVLMKGNAYRKLENPNNGRDYLLKIDGTAIELTRVRPSIYKTKFGNGVDKEFTFTHAIGSDVMVQVLDTADGTYKTVEVQALDSVRIKIKTTIAPSPEQYKILISEI